MAIKIVTLEDSMGEVLELLPVGTPVCHTKYPELVGKIVRYEYHESGKVSPIPYTVYWENSSLAHELLGFMFIYPSISEVRPVGEEESNGG